MRVLPACFFRFAMFAQTAKIVMGALCILVLALLLGSSASEGKETPLMLLGGIAVLASIVALGKKVWWLLLLFPVIAIPIPGLGFLPKYAIAMMIVLPSMMALGAMGKFKFTWHWLPLMDLLMVVLLALLVQAYIRNPADIAMFSGLDTEYIGGKEYVLFIFSFLSYITYSMIPTSMEEIRKLLRYAFVVIIFFTLLGLMLGQLEASDSGGAANGEDMQTERYGRFVGVGSFVTMWLLCRYNLSQIMLSVWRLPLFLCGVAGILLSGFREKLLGLAVVCCFISLIRRRFIEVCLAAGAGCFVLFFMSAAGILKEMPFGIQRSLAIVSFAEVTREAKESAEESADWRKEMWAWAWDDREGYIMNRMWGDGFRLKVSDVKNESEMIYRGKIAFGDLELFARAGQWHSGPIECINRIGYVGLVLCSLLMLAMLIVIFRACRALLGLKEDYIVMFILVPLVSQIALWYMSAGTLQKFSTFIPTVAFAKLLYCTALKEGYLTPMWRRERYVPLMIRQEAASSLPA